MTILDSKVVEMKLYETLGVKQFQKLVFLLEKVIHFKDKGQNINYHIKGYNVDELREFQKYLYYNGSIHVRNSIGLICFTAIQQMFLSDWFLIYTIPSLIKNIYCVMLQRYNYLRIEQAIELKDTIINNRIKRKEETFIEENKDQIEKIKNNIESLQQLEDLKKFFRGEDDVILNESSKETLQLLRNFIITNNSKVNINTEIKQQKEEKIEKNKTYCKKIGGR